MKKNLNKKKVTGFSLDQETIKYIGNMAEALNVTKSKVVNEIIKEYWKEHIRNGKK